MVLADRSGVEVLLATHTAETRALSCDVATTTDGAARLRAFDGMTGEALAGPVDAASPTLSLGRGRIRGLSLSSAGNLALSVSGADRQAVDMVIGDFEFRVRDGALEDVTLFVEGFRRSPFWTR